MDFPKVDHTLPGQLRARHGASSTNVSPFLKSLPPTLNHHQHTNDVSSNDACGDVLSAANAKLLADQLESLNIFDDVDDPRGCKSVPLLDGSENLKVSSEQNFLSLLNIENGKKVKVVSIFGNTGEGKSYTLNKLFFNGDEVFKTSSKQTSCTMGVWAKFEPKWNVICLDTEGLLGISKKEHQRTRLLLKVLAVSDIIIYRTKAERLQRDMYTFLGGASKAYKDHFCDALNKTLNKSEGEKISAGLGPGLIIFHETQHTDTLVESADVNQSAEDILRSTFCDLNLTYDAFSFIKYVGVKRGVASHTSFKELQVALQKELESTEVRSPRDAKYIYLMLKSLNEKFQSQINDANPQLYLPAFFTCPEKCQSCKSGCTLSMGHNDEGEPHFSPKDCKFQYQYQNCVYLCKQCYKNGNKTIVKPSSQGMNDSSWTSYLNYVWSGYVIDCPKCGEIYRSREHWYGNKRPEDSAVREEYVHIWSGDNTLFGTQNIGQKTLDSVTSICNVVGTVVSKPVRAITDYSKEMIAPSYWTPDSEIKDCFKCHTPFAPQTRKHHCRACGKGFCEGCSSKRQPVPSRGWFEDTRVCDDCYQETPPSLTNAADGTEVRARQLGETIVNSMLLAKPVLDIPKELIKDFVRPNYWTPDAECVQCVKCKQSFGELLPLHHCRECGKGVCDDCSKSRKTVRGWEYKQRVCDLCCKL